MFNAVERTGAYNEQPALSYVIPDQKNSKGTLNVFQLGIKYKLSPR